MRFRAAQAGLGNVSSSLVPTRAGLPMRRYQ